MLKAKAHVDNIADQVKISEGNNKKEIIQLKESILDSLNIFKISFALENNIDQVQKDRFVQQRFEFIDKMKS